MFYDAYFQQADLGGWDLRKVDLVRASLQWANLTNADLCEADLRGADLKGARLSSANLQGAYLQDAMLRGADLQGACLRQANLLNAELLGADLRGTDFRAALLQGTDLWRANLHGADLQGAELGKAELRFADLREVNFQHTNLRYASLHGTDVTGANFSDAVMASTSISGVDLSHAKGLDSVRHVEPSAIGADTLEATARGLGLAPSRRDQVFTFLNAAGVTDPVLDSFAEMIRNPIEFYSCFISYSHADKSFARRLHDQLQARGIRRWLDEHQMKVGDKILPGILDAIRIQDKVLLCCSAKSLQSKWVAKEIETALQREMREERLLLLPLNLFSAHQE